MKHKRILSFFAALLCFSAFGCTPSADSDGSLKYKSVNGLVFGNLMVLTASLFSQNRLTLDAVAESLFDLCADLEAAVSTTNAESSLYAFNAHSSAEPIAVHPMLYDLAVRAQDYYARTDGGFNPPVYPQL
jgi:thiamine biosynthesis lipoprotein ApbE